MAKASTKSAYWITSLSSCCTLLNVMVISCCMGWQACVSALLLLARFLIWFPNLWRHILFVPKWNVQSWEGPGRTAQEHCFQNGKKQKGHHVQVKKDVFEAEIKASCAKTHCLLYLCDTLVVDIKVIDQIDPWFKSHDISAIMKSFGIVGKQVPEQLIRFLSAEEIVLPLVVWCIALHMSVSKLKMEQHNVLLEALSSLLNSRVHSWNVEHKCRNNFLVQYFSTERFSVSEFKPLSPSLSPNLKYRSIFRPRLERSLLGPRQWFAGKVSCKSGSSLLKQWAGEQLRCEANEWRFTHKWAWSRSTERATWARAWVKGAELTFVQLSPLVHPVVDAPLEGERDSTYSINSCSRNIHVQLLSWPSACRYAKGTIASSTHAVSFSNFSEWWVRQLVEDWHGPSDSCICEQVLKKLPHSPLCDS